MTLSETDQLIAVVTLQACKVPIVLIVAYMSYMQTSPAPASTVHTAESFSSSSTSDSATATATASALMGTYRDKVMEIVRTLSIDERSLFMKLTKLLGMDSIPRTVHSSRRSSFHSSHVNQTPALQQPVEQVNESSNPYFKNNQDDNIETTNKFNNIQQPPSSFSSSPSIPSSLPLSSPKAQSQTVSVRMTRFDLSKNEVNHHQHHDHGDDTSTTQQQQQKEKVSVIERNKDKNSSKSPSATTTTTTVVTAATAGSSMNVSPSARIENDVTSQCVILTDSPSELSLPLYTTTTHPHSSSPTHSISNKSTSKKANLDMGRTKRVKTDTAHISGSAVTMSKKEDVKYGISGKNIMIDPGTGNGTDTGGSPKSGNKNSAVSTNSPSAKAVSSSKQFDSTTFSPLLEDMMKRSQFVVQYLPGERVECCRPYRRHKASFNTIYSAIQTTRSAKGRGLVFTAHDDEQSLALTKSDRSMNEIIPALSSKSFKPSLASSSSTATTAVAVADVASPTTSPTTALNSSEEESKWLTGIVLVKHVYGPDKEFVYDVEFDDNRTIEYNLKPEYIRKLTSVTPVVASTQAVSSIRRRNSLDLLRGLNIVKIQSLYRGWSFRRFRLSNMASKLFQQRQTAISTQAMSVIRKRNSRERLREVNIVKIQCLFRGWYFRKCVLPDLVNIHTRRQLRKTNSVSSVKSSEMQSQSAVERRESGDKKKSASEVLSKSSSGSRPSSRPSTATSVTSMDSIAESRQNETNKPLPHKGKESFALSVAERVLRQELNHQTAITTTTTTSSVSSNCNTKQSPPPLQQQKNKL